MINTNWESYISKGYDILDNIYNNKDNNTKIYPSRKKTFRCFKYFNIEDTKVVIIGQDPYHNEGQANGLCFDIGKDIKIPPSLKNIIKELKCENKPNLKKWAKQGVLLLNSSLTVCHNKPSCHMKYWQKFTDEIIDLIIDKCNNVVFVAWGNFALNKISKHLDNNNHHFIITSHPSPLSVNKNLKNYPPFKNSNIFEKINDKLEKKIIWM